MSYHCFSRKLVTAKKQHRCIWCGVPILTGSKYLRENSIYDGAHQNFAWHEACNSDAHHWFRETREEEFISDHTMPYYALYQLEVSQP